MYIPRKFQGKFSLQPDVLKNTFALGYDSIGEYVNDISKQMSQTADAENDEYLMNVPEDDRKAYKKSDIKLLIGSSIVSEIRAAVKDQTGFECSAGIAHNKILAKLVCGMNKPNKQTILPLRHIKELYKCVSIQCFSRPYADSPKNFSGFAQKFVGEKSSRLGRQIR